MRNKYLSSKNLLLVFLAIILMIIFGKFFNLLSFPDSAIVLEKGDLFKLQPESSFTQKLIANRDNFAQLEFLIRTPGIQSGDAVTLQLADENCENIIREGKLTPSFLASDNLYEFKFSAIPDSKGKLYCVKISFRPKKESAKAIQFFTMPNQDSRFAFTDAAGTANENISLSIRPVYKNGSTWQNLSELNQRISQYKPWFLKHFYLYSISILFVLLSIGVVILLIAI